jgi:hypothetical protein
MTEGEWIACDDPIAMVEFRRGSPVGEDAVSWGNNRWQLDEIPKGDNRKFRLFACACCRRIWDRIPEQCNRDAVAAVESFLEGRATGNDVGAALSASSSVEWLEDGSDRRSEPGYWAVKYLGRGFYKMTAGASALLVSSKVLFMADEVYGREASLAFHGSYYTGNGVFLRPFQWPLPVPAATMAERVAQSALLRCLFGNPFRPAALSPEWRTTNAVALARTIYDELAFDRLPILADALEDAGCTDRAILEHCRSAGPHVRGCWVVDLLLGDQ